jgi:hypothetical protein
MRLALALAYEHFLDKVRILFFVRAVIPLHVLFFFLFFMPDCRGVAMDRPCRCERDTFAMTSRCSWKARGRGWGMVGTSARGKVIPHTFNIFLEFLRSCMGELQKSSIMTEQVIG